MNLRLGLRMVWAIRWALPLLYVLPIFEVHAGSDRRPISATAMELEQSHAKPDPACQGDWGYNEQQCPEDGSQDAPYGVYVQTKDAWCRGMKAFAKEDFKKAYKLLLPFVDTGDPAAKIRIGYLLSLKPLSWPGGAGVFAAGKTRNVPLDIERGLKLLRESATSGCASAHTLLALHYFFGTSIPRNKAKAFRLATRAARNGHGAAIYLLSELYLVEKDFARRYMWKYLDIHCNLTEGPNRAIWEVMKRTYFDTSPEYRDAIPVGHRLLEQWKKSNRGRLCPRRRQ